ncbi:hypothetical protein VCRA2128O102_10224 [Vibrio crassostreae]|nr:hypothetical protein VCRA2128O102_10224 [Vibrio crassostreae]CAK3815020.1 hypothetical protein VCRA2128O96_10416 [Vibrio crassostreae]
MLRLIKLAMKRTNYKEDEAAQSQKSVRYHSKYPNRRSFNLQ